MRYITLFLLTFVIVSNLSAQSRIYALSGSVTDSATGKPIAAVSVFLNGTTKGTITRDDGSFLLNGIPPGLYQLVISAIGYAPFETIIDTRTLPANLYISLHTQATELTADTIELSDKNGWRKWGTEFWNTFIGVTANSLSATIENRKALRFFYNRKTKKLIVTAAEPIIVVNQALGYRIEYRLRAFNYDLSAKTFSYYGHPLFREMTPKNSRQQQEWETNRRLAYLGSTRHFMRSLYAGRLREEGFDVTHEVKLANLERKRVLAIYNPETTRKNTIPGDSLRYYRKIIRTPDYFVQTIPGYNSLVTINPDQTRSLYFEGNLTVTYTNDSLGIANARSALNLLRPQSLRIDENGSYFPPEIVFTTGRWLFTQTIANLVPVDYTP